jgi:hypothetical protein
MSTLTGQQIKDTYDGLLNLQDSTTGITSNYQQIQDGLGNNTNSRISTSGILSPTLVQASNQFTKPDYMGNGFTVNASANQTNSQNKVLYYPFYDTGIFSYSAISYNLNTLTSTSDVVSMAFYSLQQVPGLGIAPKDLIMSGITLLSTGSTGVKTTTLPSTLSFSGTGGGYYIAAVNYSNAGVTPTARYTSGLITSFINPFQLSLGYTLNTGGTATLLAQKTGQAGSTSMVLNLPFQSSYTESDITSNIVLSVVSQVAVGFGLKTI